MKMQNSSYYLCYPHEREDEIFQKLGYIEHLDE